MNHRVRFIQRAVWWVAGFVGIGIIILVAMLSAIPSADAANRQIARQMTPTPEPTHRRPADAQPPSTLPLWQDTEQLRPADPGALRPGMLPNEGLVEVLVVLQDPPAARVYNLFRQTLWCSDAAAGSLAAAQAERIRAAQQALIPLLTAPPINATVTGSTQQVMNSIMILVDSSQLDAIRQLPGVVAVQVLRIGELTGPGAPTLDTPSDLQSFSPDRRDQPIMPGRPDSGPTTQ